MRLAAASAALILGAGCRPTLAPPQRGSTVRFAIAADPTALNPLFIHPDADAVDEQLAALQFEPFVALDGRGRVVPVLLREVPTRANGGISRDGRTIVFHLRWSAVWSDGVPVTARDVLFTLRAILDPRNPVAVRDGYDLIERASAPDPHTIVLRLRHAWAPAPVTLFSYGIAPYVVLPAHVLAGERDLARASFDRHPTVGDGPFILQSWRRGDRLVYAANRRFWLGTPAVARLDVRIVPAPQTNLVLLQSDALDWNLIAPSQRPALAGISGLRFVRVPTTTVAAIAMNTARPPLDDPRIRRALAMSIDRALIARAVAFGVYPVAEAIQPRFSWAYDPRVREPRYDPARADRLLDAAGWRRGLDGIRRKNGRPLRLTYVAFPESSTGMHVADVVQQELRARGIAVTIKPVRLPLLLLPREGVLARGAFDLAYLVWSGGIDPDDSALLSCNAPQNVMRWCNAQVDALERRAVTGVDPERRARTYAEIERIVAREVPLIVLFDAEYLYAYRASLCGFAPGALLPDWNAWQWRRCRPAPAISEGTRPLSNRRRSSRASEGTT
jgi:peptide/nickel transport system substrate-binding protein